MTFNQLLYFYHAATLQHFNQAAEVVNVSQPSLSRSIASLEEELGVQLFEKKGRNVELTRPGAVLLKYATTILTDVQQAESHMNQIASGGGTIDLAYVAPLSTAYIPKTVRSFLKEKQNKSILFRFHQGITRKNIEGLKNGTYDIIFGSKMESENDIEFYPIIRQEMVVILPLNHGLTERAYIDSEVFGQYPILGYDAGSGLGKYTRSFFQSHQIRPEFVCESPDEVGIAALVAEGFGIALVADVDAIHRDDIVIRHLNPEEVFYHNVYMGYMKYKYQIPAVSRLIRFIKQNSTIDT